MSDAYQEFYGIRAKSAQDALGIAAANSRLAEMGKLLADGVDIDGLADYSKSTPLATAAGMGALKSVEFLLKNGAAIDKPGANNMSPLLHACSLGKSKGSKVALRLIEAGANVDFVRASDEMTALKCAAGACPAEVVEALLAKGAAVDGPPDTDQTALMIAARANNVETLKALVAGGADTTRPCEIPWARNRNALELAQMEKQRKAAEYLATVTPR